MLIAKNFLTAWPSYKPSYFISWSQAGVAGTTSVGRQGWTVLRMGRRYAPAPGIANLNARGINPRLLRQFRMAGIASAKGRDGRRLALGRGDAINDWPGGSGCWLLMKKKLKRLRKAIRVVVASVVVAALSVQRGAWKSRNAFWPW